MESTMKKARPDLNETETPLILVVDDNEQNLELIQAYLEDIECRILPAYSGAEALKLIRERMPDLILLDVMMPEMSGFEVCRQVRNDPKIKDIPIIMVTALNEFGDIERGIDCGTDDFLSKPVNRWELIARVRTMLRLKHLSDKLDRTLAYLEQLEKETQPNG
jgi:two-component system, OmpR family, alkaline phosphatase synthesis response regulator PhoP